MSQGSMTSSNYVVNLIELQNTVTSATGLNALQALTFDVNNIQQMVNFDQKRIFVNTISKFNTTPIQVTDDINLSNSFLYQNGTLFTGSGTSQTGAGQVTISSGGTAISLTNTTSAFSTAIGFQVGSRTIFSFDGNGRALYADLSGAPNASGNRFWISSATLVADRFQMGGLAAGAAPSKFLQSQDTSGTSLWAYVSSLTTGPSTLLGISSGSIFFRTGAQDAGRIDTNRNWYLGKPSLTGNNDLVNSNDVTVIGGPIRYQGGGATVGAFLYAVDSLGTLAFSSFGGAGVSSFVVGDQIQSGTTNVKVNGGQQAVIFTQATNEFARFTGTGRLGLSNMSPQATLDVGGNAIVSGSLTVSAGTGGTDYVFTTIGTSGLGSWSEPRRLFSVAGSNEFALNTAIPSFTMKLSSNVIATFSTGGIHYGVPFDVSSSIYASAYSSRSTILFTNPSGSEVVRFTEEGNVGIGVSSPSYKLQINGGQSNSGSLNIGSNAFITGTLVASALAGSGFSVTNIQPLNVGLGSNRLDIFQGVTRGQIGDLQIAVSTLSTATFSTLNSFNLGGGIGFFSTLSSYLITTSIADRAYASTIAVSTVQTYSTTVGSAMIAQFSTLSSYIVTNTVQFSTLSSLITTTSFGDRAYASTIAFSTGSYLMSTGISSLLFQGFTVRAPVWMSSLGVGYKTGLDLSGAIDVSGLIYSRGLRGLQSPFSIGVGQSTTTTLQSGGYTPGEGWRMSIQGDVDISGLIYRNGGLYTLDGQVDPYWLRSDSNIWFGDGGVGIGVPNPSYPLDVAGRIRCFGVDIIPGPGPAVSTSQGAYISPWLYQSSNIYYPNGGVGIGTGLSSVQTGLTLDISGSIRIRNSVLWVSSIGVGIPFNSTLSATADISGDLHATSLRIDTTGTYGGRVTARDFLSLSDQRYKTDIRTLETPDSWFENIRGVRFKWRDTGTTDIGVLAQEVGITMPEAIGGTEEGGYHVAYDKLIPYLIESIKSLRKRVSLLEEARL